MCSVLKIGFVCFAVDAVVEAETKAVVETVVLVLGEGAGC